MAAVTLRGRDLIADDDLGVAEVLALLERAAALKEERRRGELHDTLLRGKTVALLFQKPSTRTRVAFEAGIAQLGGQGLFLSAGDLQLGRGETIEDTGRVLARYVDAIVARVMRHADIVALASVGGGVPVINGLSDLLHPTQALADMLTVRERLGGWRGRTLAYLGVANNVAHSLLLSGATLGLGVRVVCPPGRAPDPAILARAERLAAASGGAVAVGHDPRAGVAGADIVYTDVWRSMGDPGGASLADLEPYRVTAALMDAAGPAALFMHCLPLLRGQEVAAEVADGPRSIAFDQAENRLHLHKALLVEQLGA
jgi:ornithine carbamoyltransferase